MKKKVIYWIVGILGVLFIIGLASGGDGSDSKKDEAESVDTVEVSEAKETKTPDNWNYSEEKDEMTDKTAYFASVESENSVDFDFPYDGGSTLSLTVRQSPKFGTDVYIHISKGQFMSSIDDVPVTLRFDDDKAFKVTGTEPSDGSVDLLFLSQAKSLINKLKNAKTLKVDVEFYQEGHQTFTFNVEGLKWEH